MMTYEKLIELSSLTIEKFVISIHRIQLNYSVIVDKYLPISFLVFIAFDDYDADDSYYIPDSKDYSCNRT